MNVFSYTKRSFKVLYLVSLPKFGRQAQSRTEKTPLSGVHVANYITWRKLVVVTDFYCLFYCRPNEAVTETPQVRYKSSNGSNHHKLVSVGGLEPTTSPH